MKGIHDRKALRRKTRRVVAILEQTLGVPRQKKGLPNPLDMLIATILSQNTNDKNSHRAYTSLRKKYRTWGEVARAPKRSVISAIESGGMANQKASRIQEVLYVLHQHYRRYTLFPLKRKNNDEVLSELTSLKGVGVKTAACVLLFSLRRDVFPVDTHVHRVCSRLGLAPGCRTPEQTFDAMKSIVPRRKAYSFHTNLIRFGRKLCRAHNPDCGFCPLYDECTFRGKIRRLNKRKTRSLADHDFMLLDNVRVSRLQPGGIE